MRWELSTRADPHARSIADRHYNRQKIGSPQFVPPGRCLVLSHAKAFWVTSWPFAEFVKHEWAGAWICSAFRNEGAGLSSELIGEACAATVWRFGPPPRPHGMITFINADRVKQKKDPGYCFLRAGFKRLGSTKGGLIALGLGPDEHPSPVAPLGAQIQLL